MSNAFIISDLHLGHHGILQFCKEKRPFDNVDDHDYHLMSEWNKVVGNRDVVWVLGDVTWDESRLPILDLMNGRKRLVMGNHDNLPYEEYAKYFEKIDGAVSKSVSGHRVIMTHIPIHPSEFYRWELNLHGHLHMNTLPDPRYVNVSAEQLPNLAPVNLNELVKRRI